MAQGHKEKIFCRQDIILLTILILAGVCITAWIYLPAGSAATHLEIRQNGSILMSLPLNTDTSQTITGENGETNTFQIKDGAVSMLRASCKDHTCISTGSITHTGESIVCLPHRLVLQIISSDRSEDAAPDAIVR